MKRREQLKSIFGMADEPAQDVAALTGETPPSSPDYLRRPASSGAVKAMGLSLEGATRAAREADALRESLAKGEHVVELDPTKIESSFIRDRLSDGGVGDEDFETLKQSLQANGQQVPILVRVHSDTVKASEGYYQAAYGHRRLRAARELGIPIKAIVRALDDQALVMAQGKENAERRNLSFVERALFAKALVDRGFGRDVAMAVVSVDKTEMSRLMQLAEVLPADVAQAIGPAPKIGRPRWMELAEHLNSASARQKVTKITAADDFVSASSDERFAQVFAAVTAKTAKSRDAEKVFNSKGGVALAVFKRSTDKAVLTLNEKALPGLAEAVADLIARELPRLEQQLAQEKRLAS
jgi:ParB family chromosome partitioning protein